MKSAFAAAMLIGGPLNPSPDQGSTSRAPVAEDDTAFLRAFHANALVGTGGGLDFDLVPVQTADGAAFVMSGGFPSPDGPLDLGTGWLFVRDSAGHGVVVFVDDDTSLRDLEFTLDSSADLEAEFAIAFDGGGAHLVGVFDSEGQQAFDAERVNYVPAPSVCSEARAVFLPRISVVFPKDSLSRRDGDGWPLDSVGQFYSNPGDGLFLMSTDRDELLATELQPALDGWQGFLDLAQPVQTPEGWVIPTLGTEFLDLPTLGYDRGRMFGQREVEWWVKDGAGDYNAIRGNLSNAFEMLDDPYQYGLVVPPSLDL